MKITKKNINIAILTATGYSIEIEKFEGFYYWVSDDLKTGLWLSSAAETMTYIERLDVCTVEQWVEAAQDLIADLKPIEEVVTEAMIEQARELEQNRLTH